MLQLFRIHRLSLTTASICRCLWGHVIKLCLTSRVRHSWRHPWQNMFLGRCVSPFLLITNNKPLWMQCVFVILIHYYYYHFIHLLLCFYYIIIIFHFLFNFIVSFYRSVTDTADFVSCEKPYKITVNKLISFLRSHLLFFLSTFLLSSSVYIVWIGMKFYFAWKLVRPKASAINSKHRSCDQLGCCEWSPFWCFSVQEWIHYYSKLALFAIFTSLHIEQTIYKQHYCTVHPLHQRPLASKWRPAPKVNSLVARPVFTTTNSTGLCATELTCWLRVRCK